MKMDPWGCNKLGFTKLKNNALIMRHTGDDSKMGLYAGVDFVSNSNHH